jgi:hypothetical protein
MKTNTQILLAALAALALTAGYLIVRDQRLEGENALLEAKVATLSLENTVLTAGTSALQARLDHHRRRQGALYNELAEIKGLPKYVWRPDPDDSGP